VDPIADGAARPPDHLPPEQWTALILRDVLDWPAADVASLLGLSVAALDGTLERARASVLPGDPARALPDERERAALARLIGSTEGKDLALARALLREHTPPRDRRSS
jgi:RNA polymerase sigma-70 factor, ECF subfamily